MTSGKVVSFSPLRGAKSLSRGLVPSFERDARSELVDMQLSDELVEKLSPRLERFGLTLVGHSTTDPYSRIERFYTRIEGTDQERGILFISPWVIADRAYLISLQEIRAAFKDHVLYLLAKGRDAGSVGLEPMLEEWGRQDGIEARLLAWSHLEEVLEDEDYPLPELFGLQLDPLHADDPSPVVEVTPFPVEPDIDPAEPPLVFLSYSREDTAWMRRLQQQLDPFLEKEYFRLWTDRGIEPADEWEKEIERALGEARAAVLLVSDSFLASKFIKRKELPQLLEAVRRREGFKILWVYLEACNFEETEIRRYQAAHGDLDDGRLVPLQSLEEHEASETLKRISQAIRGAVVPDEED